jgi:hypothetical protein
MITKEFEKNFKLKEKTTQSDLRVNGGNMLKIKFLIIIFLFLTKFNAQNDLIFKTKEDYLSYLLTLRTK